MTGASPIPLIIPHYGRCDQLDRCRAHLRRQSMPVEIFVRDNNRDNVYFTAAVNEGIRRFLERGSDYLVVLNQDMYLEETAVAAMAGFMNTHPRCGIGAPLQLHPARPGYVIWGGSHEAFPAGRHLHGPLADFSADPPVSWANGACLILRLEMIREIGLMDKNLVFIGSDSDYSFTARARGWEVWRIAGARGIHEHGASGVSANPLIEAIKIEDMRYFARKWLTGELYRTLAPEGPALSRAAVDEAVARMDAAAGRLQGRLAPAQEGADPERHAARAR